MKEITSNNFGNLIAFLVPGIVVLWGASYFSPTISNWLAGSAESAPSIGAVMSSTLFSLAAGVTVSTVRWAVIDSIHAWTGLRAPEWDFSRLQDQVVAYNLLNEIHYKYYLFHANLLVALSFDFVCWRVHRGFFHEPLGLMDLAFIAVTSILFAGSRDTLRKYHRRMNQLFGSDSSGQKPKVRP